MACKSFGSEWTVNKEVEGALVCRIKSCDYGCGNNCDSCDTWRLVVWMDGSNEYGRNSFSTKEGYVYGGHSPCKSGDNLPLCGKWSMAGMNCMIRISG